MGDNEEKMEITMKNKSFYFLLGLILGIRYMSSF